MIQANVHQAKSQLSKLIERAEAGEEVVIARNGKPAVRLTPVSCAPSMVGALRGKIWTPNEEELARIDAEIAQMFEDSLNTPIEGFEVSPETQALYAELVEPA